MGALPPVVRLALAWAAGTILGFFAGSSHLPAPILLLGLLWLIRVWFRPTASGPSLGITILAGLVTASLAAPRAACTDLAEDGARLAVAGRFLAPTAGRGAPIWMKTPTCGAQHVFVVTSDSIAAGIAVSVRGRWRARARGGVVIAADITIDRGGRSSLRWALVRWRGHLLGRLDALYGTRAPMVAALTLARREGMAPDLREAFARSGIAHLLAISGFHVGVVAGLLHVLLSATRLARRRVAVVASVGTWGYVALLGLPDAAFRAAVILSVVALSRARGRPPARWGALGTALLLLTLLDPRRVSGPGFQLSFAGAGALVAWSRPWRAWLERTPMRRLGTGVTSSVAAGMAATVGTLPVVAWHFERVSVVGIPATLVASPLVALALPGAMASLLCDAVLPPAGAFLAGGVDLLLQVLEWGATQCAGLGWASVWVPRSWVWVGAAGAALGTRVARRRGVRRMTRRGIALAWALAAIAFWPVVVSLQARDRLELLTLDVGQGDAVAIRTPRGRWLLVDAGPPGSAEGAGHPVVRAMRRRGVTRIETLILTHPDLDHIGGAAAVLGAFEVGVVLDPARAAGKEAYVRLLENAQRLGVPWRRAETGLQWEVDGVRFRVLHPHTDDDEARTGEGDANDASVVVWLQYGAFDALLTGDAPAGVERRVSEAFRGGIEVLKVGHHGSDTSTDSLLLVRADPRLALISAGRGNRYGHPHTVVLERLKRAGVEVRRTDRQGTVRVLARPDGSFESVAAGPGRR